MVDRSQPLSVEWVLRRLILIQMLNVPRTVAKRRGLVLCLVDLHEAVCAVPAKIRCLAFDIRFMLWCWWWRSGVSILAGLFDSCVPCQDVRKLAKGCSGPAELAGILVGDVILGINYKPLEKGLVHTSTVLAEAISLAGFVKLQVSER